MGIEATTLSAIGTILAGGAAVYGATQGKPNMPAAPAAPKPPEVQKTPERDPFKRQNQQSANVAGPMSTQLTGAGGVAPSGLSLGRNTLYDNASSKLGA